MAITERGQRAEIFAIHLRKRRHNPDAFDLVALSEATEAYSGADIEQTVITGLKLAFHAESVLTTEHLLRAAPEVRPLSKTDPERVAAMTAWLEKHAKSASLTLGSASKRR